ncbi:MAG: hypothetical protein Q8865_04160 [Bacillota bacterium]|nr:hypothetical protein [Bacillota bacterium]
MNIYKIAELTVSMNFTGETLLRQALPYKTDTCNSIDISIDVNDEKHKILKKNYPTMTANEWEYIQTGFSFYSSLLNYNGFCLHSSAVALNNKAVLFSAPCGTGKSTHTNLWQKYFGTDKAVIINDDKPAIRFINETFYVYGTPWSGKSDLSKNIRVPLQAVVFLEQAQKNNIRRLSNKKAAQMLIYQSMRFNSNDKIEKLLYLIDNLIKDIPVYQMGCTISFDAVKLAYNTINNKGWDNNEN